MLTVPDTDPATDKEDFMRTLNDLLGEQMLGEVQEKVAFNQGRAYAEALMAAMAKKDRSDTTFLCRVFELMIEDRQFGDVEAGFVARITEYANRGYQLANTARSDRSDNADSSGSPHAPG